MNAEIDISKVTLTTDRLILRPWRTDDIDDLYEYASVDGVGQPAGWLPHKSRDESREILSLFIAEKSTFAIEYGGKVTGSLGIDRYSEEEFPEFRGLLGREIGYVLSRDCWGRGLMPEAVNAAVTYLFDKVELDFILCCHAFSNSRSRRVQEKCGFKHYRTFKYTTSFGEVRDSWASLMRRTDAPAV